MERFIDILMKVLLVVVVFVIGIFIYIGITGDEVSECPKFDSSQIQLDSNQFIGEKLFLNGSDTLLMNCDLSVESESKKNTFPG